MVEYMQQPTLSQGPPTDKKKSPWGDAGLSEIYDDLLGMPHTPEGIQRLREYTTQHAPPVSTLAGMVLSNRNRILDASKQPPTSTVAQQNYEQAMASVQAPQMAGIGTGGIPVDPNTPSGVARGIAATDPSTTQFPRDNTGIAQGEMDVMLAAGGGLVELAGGGQVIPFQNEGLVPDFIPRSEGAPFGYFDPRSPRTLEEQAEYLRQQTIANEEGRGFLLEDRDRVAPEISGHSYKGDRLANLRARLEAATTDEDKTRIGQQIVALERPLPRMDWQNIWKGEAERSQHPGGRLSSQDTGNVVEDPPQLRPQGIEVLSGGIEAARSGLRGILTKPEYDPNVDVERVPPTTGSGIEAARSGLRDILGTKPEYDPNVDAERVPPTTEDGTLSSWFGDTSNRFVQGVKTIKDQWDEGTLGKNLEGFWNDPIVQEDLQSAAFVLGKELSDDPEIRAMQISNRKEFLEAVGPEALLTAITYPFAIAKGVYGLGKGALTLLSKIGFKDLYQATIVGSMAAMNKDEIGNAYDKLTKTIAGNVGDAVTDGDAPDGAPSGAPGGAQKKAKDAAQERVQNALDNAVRGAKKETIDAQTAANKIPKQEKQSILDTIFKQYGVALQNEDFADFMMATFLTYGSRPVNPAQAALENFPNYQKAKLAREDRESKERIESAKLEYRRDALAVTKAYYTDSVNLKAAELDVTPKAILEIVGAHYDTIKLGVEMNLAAWVESETGFLGTGRPSAERIKATKDQLMSNEINNILRLVGINRKPEGTALPPAEQARADSLLASL